MIIIVVNATRKVPMTGAAASRTITPACWKYIGREVRDMTATDIIMIFIGIISLLISFGSLIVAFLAFLDKRNKKK